MSSASAWQVGCVRVQQRCERLLELGAWSDCCFATGTSRELVHAHRLVLAIASPVFEAMLFGPLAESGAYIELPDIEADTFRALLKYIYTDKVDVSSCEAARALFYAAEKYMLRQLKIESIAYLLRNPQEAARTYEFAVMMQRNQLKEKCLEMIRRNAKTVIRHSSFRELQLETVVKIFSLEPLNIDSELDLFEAAKEYVSAQSENDKTNDDTRHGDVGKKEAEKNGTLDGATDYNNTKANNGAEETISLVAKIRKVDDSTNGTGTNGNNCADDDEIVPVNNSAISYSKAETPKNDNVGEKDTKTKVSIRNALENIRFLTLKHEQFAKYDFLSLLTHSEICAIAMNLMSRDSILQMPSGFSTFRESRIQLCSKATLRFDVHNFSNLKDRLLSRPCYVRGLPWRIMVRPEIDQNKKSMGLYLLCKDESKSQSWSCNPNIEFRLMSHKPDTEPFSRKVQHMFTSKEYCWGFHNFIAWNDVLDPKKDYIKDDSITLEATISADEAKEVSQDS